MEDLKEKAKNILGKFSIDIIKDEKEIIDILNSVIQDENNDIDEKIIDSIEKYIIVKEKLEKKTEVYNFLSELSNELKNQEVRRNDVILDVPLFKVTTTSGKDYYFITRKGAQNFINANTHLVKDSVIIDIKENDNLELARLIKVLKEM